jgi:Ulp1 family protease
MGSSVPVKTALAQKSMPYDSRVMVRSRAAHVAAPATVATKADAQYHYQQRAVAAAREVNVRPMPKLVEPAPEQQQQQPAAAVVAAAASPSPTPTPKPKPFSPGPVAKYRSAAVFGADVNQLRNGGWLTSKVIHFHSAVLSDMHRDSGRIHIFSTHLMDLLQGGPGVCFEDDILPWTNKVDLSLLDLILFPANINNTHWALVAAYPQYRVMQYFDSLDLDGTATLKVFRDYLNYEYRLRARPPMEPWTLFLGQCPRQMNSDDCGVYMLKNMSLLMQGLPLDYSRAEGEGYRAVILGNMV